MNREARDRAAQMRDRRAVVSQILEMLPASFSLGTTNLTPGPGGTQVLRTDRGQLIASFADRKMAQFLHDAPEHLREMSAYIEDLEAAAFDQREAARERNLLLTTVRDELLAADGHGVQTKDGQRRVRSAISAIRHGR